MKGNAAPVVVPHAPRRAFSTTKELRDYVATISDAYFDRQLAVRHVSDKIVTVEIMVPEYNANPADTDKLKHFGIGPESKRRAIAYLDALL